MYQQLLRALARASHTVDKQSALAYINKKMASGEYYS